MRKKAYGARQDSAWRQSVKDYSPSGGKILHGERRRKATLEIIQDSNQAPTGWSYIKVGERWNGRGKYVDLFLQELTASHPERKLEWIVSYGDSAKDKTAIYLCLSEHRLVQRDKLQYSVNLVLEYSGRAPKIVREKLREFAPGWYDTTVCRTEESRDLAWETLKLACERVVAWLKAHLNEWEREKKAMLSLLDMAGGTIDQSTIFDDIAHGVVSDQEERFKIYWRIHSDIERWPTWIIYSLPGNQQSGSVLELASGDPLQARDQLVSFLRHLNVTRPIAFGGRRRIEE